MSRNCFQESSLALRARLGALTAADREHTAACPDCREAVALVQAFAALEAAEERGRAQDSLAPLPPAGQVYQRAVLRRRREEREALRERAERLARLGSTVGVAATLSALAFGAGATLVAVLGGASGEAFGWLLTGVGGVSLLAGGGWAPGEA